MVSTVASGNTSQYVGATDMLLLNAVADVQGLNVITREVLANGARALAGMVAGRRDATPAAPLKPALGLTMFGVTTPCVQQVSAALQEEYDCLVFHATGTGGKAMESLLASGELSGVLDLTTTEVCDMFAGGVFPADETRFEASIAAGLPYIGACGALDMVNFDSPDMVPERYRDRKFYQHNPQVTLMRTTRDECDQIGRWIGAKLKPNDRSGFAFSCPKAAFPRCPGPGSRFMTRPRMPRYSMPWRMPFGKPARDTWFACPTTLTTPNLRPWWLPSSETCTARSSVPPHKDRQHV